MDLNKVMLIGRLTKNPELRSTANGQNVTTFSIATNRYFKDATGNKQEKAEFHTIVAWGKLAEICSQYLVKGRRVYIEGRMQTRDWAAQDGSRRYSTEVVTENMIILDTTPGGQNTPVGQQPSGTSAPTYSPPPEDALQEEQTLETIPF